MRSRIISHSEPAILTKSYSEFLSQKFSRYFPFSVPTDTYFCFQFIRLGKQRKIKKMFKIKTIPKCPKRILQTYQADEDLGIDVTKRFVVKTKEKSFTTSIYPFLQTDHLVDQLIGRLTIRSMP